MFTVFLYVVAGFGLLLSLHKSKQKTRMALKKAWKAFETMLPQFLAVILLIGLVLSLLSRETIGLVLGGQSGLGGVVIAACIGAVTLMPAFAAFPLVAALLQSGAGYAQMGAFASSLMMVGVMTAPLECQIFGKKATLLRNFAAFVFSFAVAFVMQEVLT